MMKAPSDEPWWNNTREQSTSSAPEELPIPGWQNQGGLGGGPKGVVATKRKAWKGRSPLWIIPLTSARELLLGSHIHIWKHVQSSALVTGAASSFTQALRQYQYSHIVFDLRKAHMKSYGSVSCLVESALTVSCWKKQFTSYLRGEKKKTALLAPELKTNHKADWLHIISAFKFK